jgi:hypothetical protein
VIELLFVAGCFLVFALLGRWHLQVVLLVEEHRLAEEARIQRQTTRRDDNLATLNQALTAVGLPVWASVSFLQKQVRVQGTVTRFCVGAIR